MCTLRLTGKGQWEAQWAGALSTVTHENVPGVGWSYVIRTGAPGFATVCETLDEAMAALGCDRVEVGGRQAEELARD